MIVPLRFLLISLVLTTSLSGCGVWKVWVQRVHQEPVASAAQDDPSTQGYLIEPGHSAPEVYNENYDPYEGQYEPYGRQLQRFAPPPAPPAQENDVTSDLNRQSAPAGERSEDDRLIRTLKTPRIFSPESVRSIYDRFRKTESQSPPAGGDRPEGPIALRSSAMSPTQPCAYAQISPTISGPVQLGIPETAAGPLRQSDSLPVAACGRGQSPAVVQACPSAYRQPMFADP